MFFERQAAIERDLGEALALTRGSLARTRLARRRLCQRITIAKVRQQRAAHRQTKVAEFLAAMAELGF